MSEDSPAPLHNTADIDRHLHWFSAAMTLRNTLMSDVRTSVSLIGFGFTVAQFFRHLMVTSTGAALELGANMPRNVGLLLIGVGVVSMVASTANYHQGVVQLKGVRFVEVAMKTWSSRSAYLVASAVMLIGVLAFLSILYRF
ncbi:MAG TPA: DUF202 domain-containing protein [Croceibacterium sp.]